MTSINAPPSSGVLGDWYVNALNVGRARLLLAVAERSLLPVLLPARRAEFPGRFAEHVGVVLARVGVGAGAIDQELRAMREVVVARTRSRRVLGVMNDFAFLAEAHLRHGGSLVDVALRVAEAPSSPLGYRSAVMTTREVFVGDGRRP